MQRNPDGEPSEEKRLMTILGFSTLPEMEDWMNSEKDPALLAELDGPDLEEEAAERLGYETTWCKVVKTTQPVRERMPSYKDLAGWKDELRQLGLPIDLPAPSVEPPRLSGLNSYLARQVVESVLSAHQQYDGAVIATGTGTGKTYTQLAIAKHYELDRPFQLIVTKSKTIIRQDDSFRDVGAQLFGLDVLDIPDAARCRISSPAPTSSRTPN